jgi:ABC-2 type transport system ATP-binding protein
MSGVIETAGLTKRYGRRTALDDCTLSIPAGHVVALVGPNGAGKTTLLQLAVGLIRPTAGTVTVLGDRPAAGPKQLARVGFVAQDAPVYGSLTVADHLKLGAKLNPGWDAAFAARRIDEIDLDPKQRAGKLSGGQRAQLALTLAVGKRPDLLVLDEPVASLDPLARRDFLQDLMAFTAETGTSVILSSHLIADLERVCDYLVLLTSAHVQLADEVDELLASHWRLTGPRQDTDGVPPGCQIVYESHTDRQSTYFVRCSVPVDHPGWAAEPLGLEDLVLAYLSTSRGARPARRLVREVTR